MTDPQRALATALCKAIGTLEEAGLDALVVGGIALSFHLTGEAVVDHDVDLFIRENDVDRAAEALSRAGFEVSRTHPTWLFKARLDGATVDVLYVLGRILKLEDDMLLRARPIPVDGCTVKGISREDLALGQAGAARAATPNHWFQAVDLLRDETIDWDYLITRGAVAPDRLASLLHFARSEGIAAPID